MIALALSASLALAFGAQQGPAAAPTGPTAPASGETPTEVSGVEVPGGTPNVKVSRREIAIAKKQLKSRGNQVICRRAQVTGSRFPGPAVCKTNRDWDRSSAENRRNIDRALSNQWVPDEAGR